MNRRLMSSCIAGACLVLMGASAVHAVPVVTTYDNQGDFLTATSGAAGFGFEDFEGFDLDGGSAIGVGPSLFLNGPESDLTFTAPGGTANTNDLIVGAPAFGQPSQALFANFFVDTLRAEFLPGINAVGSDVFSEFNDSAIDITLRDGGGVISMFSIAAGDAGTFFGFTVDGGEVVQIDYASQSDQAEGVDNFYWGNIEGTSVIIPLPTSLGMGLAGLGLIGLARRRR